MLSPSLVLLSDQSAISRSMDIIANNVANSSTNGFKREGIEFDTYVSRPAANKTLNFVVDRATYRDASVGPIKTTGNPLDLAIEGSGYFEVQAPDGTTKYTRAGSFQLNSQGQIVNQSGYPVLSDGNAPITIPDTTRSVTITGDGTVSARVDDGVDLAVIGKVGLANFADEQQMQAQGGGLYTTSQTALPTTDSATIVQGSLEESNVSPIEEMTAMIRIMRSYEQTSNLITQENQRLDNAISILSKTS